MSGSFNGVEVADLHALVDGEISLERRRQVEDHLLQHPEDAALVENWRRQNAALRAAFEPVAAETPPLSLRNAAARNAASGPPPIETGAIHWGRPSSSRSVRRLDEARESRRKKAALSFALTLLAGAALAGGAIYGLIHTGSASMGAPSVTLAQGYVDRADVDYLTYAREPRPVEYDADREADLLALLRLRVGYAKAPDLSPAGLRFLGGRVTPGLVAPAGFLVYEAESGQRVGLYFEKAEAGPAPRLAPRVDSSLTAVEWRGAGMAFILIGPLSVEAMQAAAEQAAAEIFAPAASGESRNH
jgi:anti-sigma factor RsiW